MGRAEGREKRLLHKDGWSPRTRLGDWKDLPRPSPCLELDDHVLSCLSYPVVYFGALEQHHSQVTGPKILFLRKKNDVLIREDMGHLYA